MTTSSADGALGTGGTPVSRPLSPPARAGALLPTVLPALCLSIFAAALCRAVADVSLGLFFGGVAFATLLVPPLTSAESTLPRRALVAALVSLGVALTWLTALGDLLYFTQWLACSAVLAAYAFALAGLCGMLISARFNSVVAAGSVTILALLWLTWPVWLSAALLRPAGESLAAWLVPAHPLFATNGVLSHFDSWDRFPLAYRQLTVLNQDVFYAMPATVIWAGLLHGAVAVVAFGASRLLLRRPRQS